MSNPTTRSRKKWRDQGYYVETVEHINRIPGGLVHRSDLFGFVDLLAIPPNRDLPWVYLQVTSRGNISSRVRKIQQEKTGKGQWAMPMRELAKRVISRGDEVIVEGWDKRNGRWRDKERKLTLEDLEVN